jgi:hypothetical protein
LDASKRRGMGLENLALALSDGKQLHATNNTTIGLLDTDQDEPLLSMINAVVDDLSIGQGRQSIKDLLWRKSA